MHRQRREMAFILPLILLTICISAAESQANFENINTLLRDISVQLATHDVEMKDLKRQNEEQATTLTELKLQKSELEKLQQQDTQQQQQQLQQQQQQLQQLQQQDTQQQEQLKQQQEHNAQLQQLINMQAAELVTIKTKADKDREGSQVAFSASLSGSGFIGPFITRTNLTFRNVFVNIGNAYNPETGVFTAPVRGAYHFEFHIYGRGDSSHRIGAYLMKNTQVICSAHELQSSGGRLAASNGATLLLEVGDVVFVRSWWNSKLHDDHVENLNTFSGHLLFTM